jgi:putative copper export protein
MLSPSTETLRLFLHVIAASVWVGGQFALAGLVPTLRRVAPDAVKTVAQAFARVAWPAFGLTVITGMWSLMAEDITTKSSSYQATLLLKIAVAIMSGVFVVVHTVGKSKAALAVGGALGLLTAVGAMYLGILLNTRG